jgi:integrase
MWQIRRVKFEDGERYVMLTDRVGMPLYEPNLFVTNEFRNSGKSVSTMEAVLRSIQSFLAWEQDQGIDVIERFKAGEFLAEVEIEALTSFLSYRQDTADKILAGAKLVPSAYRYKNSMSVATAVAYVAEYLGFLFKNFSPHQDKSRLANEFVLIIKKRKPKVRSYLNELEDKALTPEELDAIKDVIQVDSPKNVWKGSETQRLRNLIMYYILFETGIRRGELANLRVSDIEFAKRALKIRRRQHSKSDPRVEQPNVKTRERTIPLSEGLISAIYAYLVEHRNKSNKARLHDILFVSHHPRNEGQPLSLSAINKVFQTLQERVPALSNLHPHRLRHHANYELSLVLDEKFKNMSSEDKAKMDAQVRSPFMGWSPTGGQQARYNKRFIMEEVEDMQRRREEQFGRKENSDILRKKLDEAKKKDDGR